MNKPRLFLYGGILLIIVIMVVGRIQRQAKNANLTDAHSNVVSVSAMVAQPEPFVRRIEETGVLTGNKEATVAAETGGRVLEVKVDVGDVVREGQPLVRLDDELYKLDSDRAKIAYDKAKLDLDRAEKLYTEKSISDADIENARLGAKSAEVQYRMALKTYNNATIRAPFNGTVAAKMTEVGQMVERGMAIAQLVDVSALKLTVQVSEGDLESVSIGAPATIIVDAVGDTIQGKVAAIGSRANTGSRTFPVEIRLPGDKALRSGMFARAIIASRQSEDGLLLPRAALLPDAGRTIIFRARQGAAEKVSVRVIGTQGDRVAVDGITRGDTIVTTGNQTLSQGTLIAPTLDSRSSLQ
ncbi:MAG TPA: efflux RND transporter periplasmic adaptor subunit [bacterium]|jgi:RND family efflux transporter MFP subunit